MNVKEELERIEEVMFAYFQDSVNPAHIKGCAQAILDAGFRRVEDMELDQAKED